MNYFMSDIHGAADAYFTIKDRIALKTNDMLYILGDIFDGNDKDPGACIRILDDIIAHDNIRLLLGDHEYAHIMYHISDGDKEQQKDWENLLLTESCRGKRLHAYILNHLSPREIHYYMSFLIEQDLTDLIKIGNRQFYLVHGAPALCTGDPGIWQQAVVTTGIDFCQNYRRAILSDPDAGRLNKAAPLKGDEIIICGHTPTKFLSESVPRFQEHQTPPPHYQKVVLCNNVLAIDCGCKGSTLGREESGWISDLCCVGIDAAGFFVEHLLGKES